MKKILILIFLFSWLNSISQEIKEGTIYYKDNRVEKGFIRFGEKTNIWFKKNIDSTEVLRNYNDIYKFQTISEKGSIRNYHYELVPGKSSTSVILVDEDLGKGELFFKNKTQKKGIIKIKKNRAIYKENKDSEEELYDFNSIYKLTMNNDHGEVEHHEYKLFVKENKTKVFLLELRIKGKVSFYYRTYLVNNELIGSGTYSEYYLSKENDLYVTKILLKNTKNGQFRKNVAPLFFNDCPTLMDKINKKQFDRYDFKGIVNYYNTKCNN